MQQKPEGLGFKTGTACHWHGLSDIAHAEAVFEGFSHI